MEGDIYLRVFKRWYWLFLLAVALGTVPTYLISSHSRRTYSATATVLVHTTSSNLTSSYNDALLNQQLVKSYVFMVRDVVVMNEVRQRLGLLIPVTTLQSMIKVKAIRDTELFEITARAHQTAVARDLANVSGQVFIEQHDRAASGVNRLHDVHIIQPAVLPEEPVAPKVRTLTAIGGIAAIVLTFIVVGMIEFFDDTIRAPELVKDITLLPTLGVVKRLPVFAESLSNGMSRGGGRDSALEPYRIARTTLDYMGRKRPLRSLLITSANPSEGKSTTAANLSLVLAQGGKHVVIVDADLRKPSLHQLFDVDNTRGLTNVLRHQSLGIAEVLQQTKLKNLAIITSGPLPPNPVEMLSSSRFHDVLTTLMETYDIVVMDGPPLLGMADALVLSASVDGAVFVVDVSRTSTFTVQQALQSARTGGVPLLGVIANRVATTGVFDHIASRLKLSNAAPS